MGVRPHFTASCHKWQENLNKKKHHTKIRKQFGQPIWGISCNFLCCTWNHRSASVPWPSSHAAWTKATKAMAWQVKVLQLESSDFQWIFPNIVYAKIQTNHPVPSCDWQKWKLADCLFVHQPHDYHSLLAPTCIRIWSHKEIVVVLANSRQKIDHMVSIPDCHPTTHQWYRGASGWCFASMARWHQPENCAQMDSFATCQHRLGSENQESPWEETHLIFFLKVFRGSNSLIPWNSCE